MADPILGTLRVSNDVIADLAGYAAFECYGVVGMAYTDAQDNIVRLLSLGSLRKGIDVTVVDGRVKVDLHTVLEQGVNMASVSRAPFASRSRRSRRSTTQTSRSTSRTFAPTGSAHSVRGYLGPYPWPGPSRVAARRPPCGHQRR